MFYSARCRTEIRLIDVTIIVCSFDSVSAVLRQKVGPYSLSQMATTEWTTIHYINICICIDCTSVYVLMTLKYNY